MVDAEEKCLDILFTIQVGVTHLGISKEPGITPASYCPC